MQSHPEASNPVTGPQVPWTSGVLGMVAPQDKDDDSRFLVTLILLDALPAVALRTCCRVLACA